MSLKFNVGHENQLSLVSISLSNLFIWHIRIVISGQDLKLPQKVHGVDLIPSKIYRKHKSVFFKRKERWNTTLVAEPTGLVADE